MKYSERKIHRMRCKCTNCRPVAPPAPAGTFSEYDFRAAMHVWCAGLIAIIRNGTTTPKGVWSK